jgi:cyclophilin family peptidyl-prolyl cis-trans isomerase
LREHAQTALRLLGERKRRCDEYEPQRQSPKELARKLPEKPRLRVVMDTGTHELMLDTTLAPVAVARVLDLARSGFYSGTVVHRVVPGFVVQFGDRGGDGFGGAGRQPLACETAPVSFAASGVGVALSGRDTGSSQLFVSLGRYPHLDGDYTLIGTASPGWGSVAAGDVIRKVEVLE